MKTAHIVLIEDNPADVLLLRLALQESKLAHRLTEFEDGGAAVEYFCSASHEAQDDPDAILLDLNTPRTDGLEALAQLRQRFADVPIAVITSSRAPSDKARAAELGAFYIEKPSDLHSFLNVIATTVKELLRLRGFDLGESQNYQTNPGSY